MLSHWICYLTIRFMFTSTPLLLLLEIHFTGLKFEINKATERLFFFVWLFSLSTRFEIHSFDCLNILIYYCIVFEWWRRQWHPIPVLLPGKSHGWRSLVGCSPWGRWGSDTTERLHFHFPLSCMGEGNGNPLQCSPGESQGWESLVGCCLWGLTELDTTEVISQQQQQRYLNGWIYGNMLIQLSIDGIGL